MSIQIKLNNWDDEKAKKEILKRYEHAKEMRKAHELSWLINEETVYPPQSGLLSHQRMRFLPGGAGQYDDAELGEGVKRLKVPHTFKNVRFLHAQMSANPPSVIARPSTTDKSDYARAVRGDKVMKFLGEKLDLQEHVDSVSLSTMVYGSGVLKAAWDPLAGKLISYDKESGEMSLEGDFLVYSPDIRDIYIDSDAKRISDIKHIIETIYIDYEESLARWPNKEDELKKSRVENGENGQIEMSGVSSRDRYKYFNVVKLLEYWETGLPTNGFMGRYCLMAESGHIIEPCRPSPHRFKEQGAVFEIEKMSEETFREEYSKYSSLSIEEAKEEAVDSLPEIARLPYHILTDIDVPGTVWGKSPVEYAAPLEDLLNKIDTAHLANIRAHGSTKLVAVKGANITHFTDDALTVIESSMQGGVSHLQPPGVMPEMVLVRKNIIDSIDQVFGVNEAMFGQQSREQAAALMQYATNQGNMVRRRLFNKYVGFVKSLYSSLRSMTTKHWNISKVISVVGSEGALEREEIKGKDLDGGFEFEVEYGRSFSLDPQTRYQQILLGMPLFEKAGVKPRQLLRYLRLSELDSIHDSLQAAENRMRGIFSKIVSTEKQVAPQKYQDHENMLAYALEWFMTPEFFELPENMQDLCREHFELRAQLAAAEQTGIAGPGGELGESQMGAASAPAEELGPVQAPATPLPGEAVIQPPEGSQ